MRDEDLPGLSVVIASLGRPGWLARCLLALTLQDHPRMEVILVSDAQGLAVRGDLPIRRLRFDHPNLSQARNLGIARAAGRVVAFIDDDAVPDPAWARALAGAFRDPAVMAATGPVRGPDGVRWQARAEWLTADGPAPLHDHAARLWYPAKDGTLSTIGTNCAFRRDLLARIGGFDPLFAFHLDESDLNLRMAAACPQMATAFVPQAEVGHAAADGTTRQHGAPARLCAIGRSEAVFARRHAASPGWQGRVRRREYDRLLRAMLAGRIDPFHVRPIMAGLDEGLAQGREIAYAMRNQPSIAQNTDKFMPLPVRARGRLELSGWIWQARRLRDAARAAIADGRPVRLMLWSPGFLRHREWFTKEGWWERRGGTHAATRPQNRR